MSRFILDETVLDLTAWQTWVNKAFGGHCRKLTLTKVSSWNIDLSITLIRLLCVGQYHIFKCHALACLCLMEVRGPESSRLTTLIIVLRVSLSLREACADARSKYDNRVGKYDWEFERTKIWWLPRSDVIICPIDRCLIRTYGFSLNAIIIGIVLHSCSVTRDCDIAYPMFQMAIIHISLWRFRHIQ